MSNAKKDLETAIKNFIDEYVEDPDREGLEETPHRFVKHLMECIEGYDVDPNKCLKVFDSEASNDLITVSSITFSSLCEHHLAPFFGKVEVSYIPRKKILGLSKFARIVDAFSKRLQVQERLTKQLADILYEKMEPELLMIKMSAKHTCMSARGVKRHSANTTTTALRGDIKKYNAYVGAFCANTDGES